MQLIFGFLTHTNINIVRPKCKTYEPLIFIYYINQ